MKANSKLNLLPSVLPLFSKQIYGYLKKVNIFSVLRNVNFAKIYGMLVINMLEVYR